MLKWTVYGKKNHDVPIYPERLTQQQKECSDEPLKHNIRRSLDSESVKRSKKPSRYQRRSVGSHARKNIKSIDKENVNYAGNTPNFFREGFIKKSEGIAFKDVSNITPKSTTPVKALDRHSCHINVSKGDVVHSLPPTPPTYSRRVREAKKRKLEMSSLSYDDSFKLYNSSNYNKSERIIKYDRPHLINNLLPYSRSEPSLNDLTKRLSNSFRSSNPNLKVLTKIPTIKSSISTTKIKNEDLVEIEYDENLVINCTEKPLVKSDVSATKTTLPIFGHHLFIENPLYFNKNENLLSNIRPFKRTRKKSNDFESTFKSPSIDRKDPHTMIREACSPISITPISLKLSAFQFSTISTHSKSQQVPFVNNVSDYFPKIENAFSVPLRDEESNSIEMENKNILSKDTTNETESTVSTTQMGDVTLEKMIEDIIKSTKIVKSRRRVLKNYSSDLFIDDEVPSLAAVKDLFIKPQSKKKTNIIKEAKYINLSRENSLSSSNYPVKISQTMHGNDKLLKSLPIGCFMLEDKIGYNEREVKTPDKSCTIPCDETENLKNVSLNRSQSMNDNSYNKSNIVYTSSDSSPNLFSATKEFSRIKLRRQRCIRRKKSTVSDESIKIQKSDEIRAYVTHNNGIPSPALNLLNVSLPEEVSVINNSLDQIGRKEYQENISFKSDVSHSSLKYDGELEKNKKSQKLFGFTLDNEIPSPIVPLNGLKRVSNTLSEERANKTSKLEEEFLPIDVNTPLLEHKASRRCLTYSPEETSINSNEEKRGSVASDRSERNGERNILIKGTIDLEIITRNNTIDVHVIRCRDLHRSSGKTDDINAYAKVVISGLTEKQTLPPQRSIFQRTSVVYGKKEPEFQRHLKLPLPSKISDDQMLHISVWHRDKKYRRSEFLGCVSFPLKDAINEDTSGTYFLQSTPGKPSTAPAHLLTERKMATDNNAEPSTNEETKENHNEKGVITNGPATSQTIEAQAAAAALQKEADEHLFLRYLELDPPDDPAAPKKTQRPGRTPFTTTRKLIRGSGGGFGFTVVWTRPPRVERVAAGGSAERAGLRAGDYIVFVGAKNVVTASEEDVRNLVKSSGQILILETFRRIPLNGAGTVKSRVAHVTIPMPAECTPPPAPRSPRTVPAPASPAPAARPPTACSSTSQSLDRRKLHLPQVTFSKEAPSLTGDGRKRALLAVVAREQHYATCLQFGLVRFVSPLAERADLIIPSDHQLLFQNIEEILRLSEDILDQVIQEDGEIQTSTVVAVYLQKTPVFLSLYKKYCLGLKRADCVLVKKSKDPSGAFSRFCTSPPIPRRKPDITSLIHKPLEQFRELLRLMRAASSSSGSGPYDQLEKKQLQVIVEQLQCGYQDVTAGSGLMGLAGDGRPLLSVSDLESRLVFTRCKPFVLSTGGRQWIFGGELSRVEGRTIRPYWALLFTDLLLFATVSRDRVLFVTEEPVALGMVSEAQFNIRKKVTEFRLILGRTGGESPLVSCSLRTPSRTRTIALRAPSIDLKAVWQSLLQRQIHRVHTMSGTPLGSPLDSPDPQLTFSLATLDSQQRQMRRSSVETQTGAGGSLNEGAKSIRSRGSSLHLQRWMTQLPEAEELDPPDTDLVMWSVEELRRRSKELNLLEVAERVKKSEAKCSSSDKKEHDHSPSKSSNSGSQITVRTSPVIVDTIPVCKQCHKKCLSKPNSPLISQKEPLKVRRTKIENSPQNSNSYQSSISVSSVNCDSDKVKVFTTCLRRQGAMKIRPEDAPKAALKVINSIEESQKMLKSTSYELKTDPPTINKVMYSPNQKRSLLELRKDTSVRTPSPASSSRNNSPFSTSHTTCSSMVFNSSSNDLRISNSNIENQFQCVIAQEKFINEVKRVENITLLKKKDTFSHNSSLSSEKIEDKKQQVTVNVNGDVACFNTSTKREKFKSNLRMSSIFIDDKTFHEKENDSKVESIPRKSPKLGVSALLNGDIGKKIDCKMENKNSNSKVILEDDNIELGPLMLMSLSAVNPTTHFMGVESFSKACSTNVNNVSLRPGNFPSNSIISNSSVPNIAVVPATPEYNHGKTTNLPDDSPDSPDVPEDLPYISLKRYGTMSSLERVPSDETDDGNIKLTSHEAETTKSINHVTEATGGLMGWTARAGSFVVEKMNIFSTPEILTNAVSKQPSFLERCLGVGDWKSAFSAEDAALETGEGSGASGEEAWGTPSSGDLSDNLADSEHGTLSSPTKSSSSYAGDDDTELMMDELLMAPTLTGPTTMRPLLPRDVFRRRLEPLLEEDGYDSDSEDNKRTPTNNDYQDSSLRGLGADDGCSAPHPTSSASKTEAEDEGAGAAPSEEQSCAGDERGMSPELTPTNEAPILQSVLKECAEARGAVVAGGRRDSAASSASTPSTLERTTIHNPTGRQQLSPASERAQVPEEQEEKQPTQEERLSPRAEMRLALDQGKDMLADQETSWGGGSDPWSFRAACQRSLLRRVSSADAVTLCRVPPHRTAPHTTSRSSVYAWKAPENEKVMEMEQLAQVEAQKMRSRTRSLCQNGKILGFLHRRASSDSPRRGREPIFPGSGRPFSPRRTTDKQFEKRFNKQINRRRQSSQI